MEIPQKQYTEKRVELSTNATMTNYVDDSTFTLNFQDTITLNKL